MKGRQRQSTYQVISFFQKLILFFHSFFLYFPSHVRRIILYFVYSNGHKPTIVYPSLEKDNLHYSCIVYVDPIPSVETHEEDDVHISISPEPDYSCHPLDYRTDLLPSTISAETCNQPVESHFHPTEIQSRIREKKFKSLKLPSTLHP
jgi:hypothetical protein